MTDSLLMTKVSLPLLRHTLVTRERILRQLTEGVREGHLLTLVSAPAGYGKTTAIRMWVENVGRAVAWVTLDKSDSDLRQFLTYVLTALEQAEEDLGQGALEVVENAQEIDLQHILRLLINDLRDLEHPVILVLEDYHLIENEHIDQFMASILGQAVANLHLVITTREDPGLPLTRLRVNNQLTELRAMDLSFSLEETGEFLSTVMQVNLSPEAMAVLKTRTEGWVAGLQLAALSLKERGNPARLVEAFRGTHRHVLDYLIEEVLRGQPDEIQEFLRRTSILDQLSASLCEAVTAQKASREYLHYLEHNNLFLVSLDEERTWYRYHALFAELLRNQLLQAEPEQVDVLHERAADWYQKNGFIQQAVAQAFQVSSHSKASQLIEQNVFPMLYRGEVSTVVGWFDRLRDPLGQTGPLMHIARAWSLALMQREARTEEVEQALQAGEAALDLAHADEALRNLIAGHTTSVRAFLMQVSALTEGKPEALIALSQRAQQLLPEDERAIRSVNALNIGYGYTALADLPAAERALKQVFEDGVAGGNLYAAIYGPITLIAIAIIKGQLQDALQLCETSIVRFNKMLAGQNFPSIGALHILKGDILLEQNRLEEADQALTLGLSLIRWTGEYETHMRGHAAVARLRSIRGNREGMLESIELLAEAGPEGGRHAEALRHRLSLRDAAATPAHFEEAQRWATPECVPFSTLPDLSGVDPVSETHFRTLLSAAHVVTRLAARNARADALRDAQSYLARQEAFISAHGLLSWWIEVRVVRALMCQVEGRAEDARHMLQAALEAAASRGYFRVFLDEGDVVRPLLQSVAPLLKASDLSAFVKRLLEAMPGEQPSNRVSPADVERLSERELAVLRLLAAGQSYREIGQQLFLSLNTVQFHVKNTYSKLAVNKRVQAIEKAREKGLI